MTTRMMTQLDLGLRGEGEVVVEGCLLCCREEGGKVIQTMRMTMQLGLGTLAEGIIAAAEGERRRVLDRLEVGGGVMWILVTGSPGVGTSLTLTCQRMMMKWGKLMTMMSHRGLRMIFLARRMVRRMWGRLQEMNLSLLNQLKESQLNRRA
uniref:Uncharacterized protein n=1 Tax=Arundo donax TaxID=35708 RepID=A0A0A9GGA2_ARUDO